MRDHAYGVAPGDRDGLRRHAPYLGEPPVRHLDDEHTAIRQDRDQIRIAPPHHRLVVDKAVVRQPREGGENTLSPPVLDAGNVSGIISAMALGRAL